MLAIPSAVRHPRRRPLVETSRPTAIMNSLRVNVVFLCRTVDLFPKVEKVFAGSVADRPGGQHRKRPLMATAIPAILQHSLSLLVLLLPKLTTGLNNLPSSEHFSGHHTSHGQQFSLVPSLSPFLFFMSIFTLVWPMTSSFLVHPSFQTHYHHPTTS
jgi:hypothetical protein